MLALWVDCPCVLFLGLPVLLINMELGLECQELQWLLQRDQLSPPQVQPGFCLYLSTTLPLHALEKGEAQWVSCQCSSVDTQSLQPLEGFEDLIPQQAQDYGRESYSTGAPPQLALLREGVKYLLCVPKC